MAKKEWGGFHLIEQALYVNNTAAGMAPVAKQLQADVEQLQGLIADTQYEPATIANGAVELLNEVSASKITGEEERYSRTDLVDFLANVEGAQAAFNAVKPILVVKNAALATQIDERFADVYADARAVRQRFDLRALHRSHQGRHQEALPVDRRARRAAVEGGEEGRLRAGPMTHDERSPVSRRRFLGAAGAAGALGAAATLGADALVAPARAFAATGDAAQIVPFHGTHQAGISTAVQDRLMFAAFDVQTEDRAELVDLMREWTRASERMSVGRPVGRDNDDLVAPPDDTGEAVGLTPANLTVTFGFGASLFARNGAARFGLDGARPEALVDLPVFNSDVLDPARSDGDIAVQACADDPQVAFHAIRNLTRIGRGIVTLRWSQLGFGRTSTTSPVGQTPRNLMGFKDGTNNLKSDEAAELDRHVWVAAKDGPAWMTNGSYVVIRRIRMLLEVWDRSTLGDQEQTIGRSKEVGAPLGERREHQPARSRGAPRRGARDPGRRARATRGTGDRTTASRSCVGATRSPTGSTPCATSSTPGSSSSRTSGIRARASSRCRNAWLAPMRSTSTSDTRRAACTPCRPGVRPGGYIGETLLSA